MERGCFFSHRFTVLCLNSSELHVQQIQLFSCIERKAAVDATVLMWGGELILAADVLMGGGGEGLVGCQQLNPT